MLFPRLVLLAPRSIDLDAVVCRPLLGQRSRFQSGDVPAVAVATGRANGRFELAKSSASSRARARPAASPSPDRTRRPGADESHAPVHFLLFHDVAPDDVERRELFRTEHLALAWEAVAHARCFV